MTTPIEVSGSEAPAEPAAAVAGVGPIEGRSLGQIAWLRLKRDKVAMAGAAVMSSPAASASASASPARWRCGQG